MARKVRPIVTRSAQDLATLLDLNEAEARWIELRSGMLARLIAEVQRQGLTHSEVAARSGTSRTRLTRILNGNLDGISTDLLLRILGSLGLQAHVRFSRAA